MIVNCHRGYSNLKYLIKSWSYQSGVFTDGKGLQLPPDGTDLPSCCALLLLVQVKTLTVKRPNPNEWGGEDGWCFLSGR
jgi:hypothetical protein